MRGGNPRASARRPHGRRGAVLLDVLLAMVLLAVGGMSLVVCLTDAVHTLRVMRGRDAAVRGAAAELSRVGSWSRAELAANTGSTRRDAIDVIIAPMGPDLYHAAVAEAARGAILLETSYYRPTAHEDSTR